MSKILIVSYGSPKPLITETIEKFPNKRKVFENFYLIATDDTPADFYARLELILNKNTDRVFISELSKGGYQGWLSLTIWDWVETNLF
jgi:hypothetical protein